MRIHKINRCCRRSGVYVFPKKRWIEAWFNQASIRGGLFRTKQQLCAAACAAEPQILKSYEYSPTIFGDDVALHKLVNPA